MILFLLWEFYDILIWIWIRYISTQLITSRSVCVCTASSHFYYSPIYMIWCIPHSEPKTKRKASREEKLQLHYQPTQKKEGKRLDQTLTLLLLRLRIIPRIFVSTASSRLRSTTRLTRTSIKLVDNLLGDTVQQILRVDTQQVPGDIERFIDWARLVGGLGDEGSFEFFEEFEGEFVFGWELLRQRRLSWRLS